MPRSRGRTRDTRLNKAGVVYHLYAGTNRPRPKNGREDPKLVSKMALKKLNTNFCLEHSVRENRTIFSDVPLLPENFRWNGPKKWFVPLFSDLTFRNFFVNGKQPG